jgi:diguanylate cyclase (GGDEF)-like protein/PAS domain S-box-containing protein
MSEIVLYILIILLCATSIFFAICYRRYRALHDQSRIYKEVIEQSPISIVITDELGVIEYVNRQFEKRMNYSRDEVIGHHSRLMKSGLTPKSVYEELWSTITQGNTWSGDINNKTRAGHLFFEKVKISPVNMSHSPTKYVGFKEDISLLKSEEKRLRLMSSALNSVQEGVLITDLSGKIITQNCFFSLITGFDKVDISNSESYFYQRNPQIYNLTKELTINTRWEGDISVELKSGLTESFFVMAILQTDNSGNDEGFAFIFRSLSERIVKENTVKYQENFDFLTGLATRKLLLERMTFMLQHAQTLDKMSALLCINLDRFQYVNDSLGHDVGDIVLKQAATRLKALVRVKDTAARLSGDGFAIFLTDVYSEGYVNSVAQQIVSDFRKPFTVKGNIIHVSVSIGCAFASQNAEGNCEELLRASDIALHNAKAHGRDNYKVFSQQMSLDQLRRREVELGLRNALEQNLFNLVYQPIVDSVSSQTVGFEALIRWNDFELGLVYPDEFIPIAEECGLINEIDAWVINQACKEAVTWKGLTTKKLFVSVNLSIYEFKNIKLVEHINRTLDDTQLPPALLTVEVSEGLFLENADVAVRSLTSLAEKGVSFAIDDFGTGCSSLSSLKRYPISLVKIDKQFTANMLTDDSDKAIVKGIISISKSMDIKLVGEGVERTEQKDFLCSLGCDFLQGYLYSDPLTDTELKEYIIKQA